jgi:hypothetical protein
MGYPYGKTYLEQIKEKPEECKHIREAFYVLLRKYVKEHDGYTDPIELSIQENFSILGEAFELASDTVGSIQDTHHFMWDVLDELLGGEW